MKKDEMMKGKGGNSKRFKRIKGNNVRCFVTQEKRVFNNNVCDCSPQTDFVYSHTKLYQQVNNLINTASTKL